MSKLSVLISVIWLSSGCGQKSWQSESEVKTIHQKGTNNRIETHSMTTDGEEFYCHYFGSAGNMRNARPLFSEYVPFESIHFRLSEERADLARQADEALTNWLRTESTFNNNCVPSGPASVCESLRNKYEREQTIYETVEADLDQKGNWIDEAFQVLLKEWHSFENQNTLLSVEAFNYLESRLRRLEGAMNSNNVPCRPASEILQDLPVRP